MRPLLAVLVDLEALGETAIAAFVAGIVVAASFSGAILGSIRFSEASRAGRTAEAGLYAVCALVGGLITAAAVIFGVVAMAAK